MDRLDRIAAAIDQISIWSGKIVAWLIFPMFLVLFYEVMVRKFWQPTIWANDLATMFYGTHFFIAAAYTL
jgi:TRAP-type mannitol/chloroaromatic compound transport system permease small subunit